MKKERIIEKGGWSALFWTNHDYQRLISLYGDEKNISKSASAFATLMYLLKGTPIIYMGEEIGMSNYPFKKEEELEDINAKTLLSLAKTKEEKEKIFKTLARETRDNARTIMQWSGAINAGFSEAKPWFVVNNNYHQVNVERQLKEEDSVLSEYKKILALRQSDKDIFCYGDIKFDNAPKGVIQYRRLLKDDNRVYFVIVNPNASVIKYTIPAGEIVYSNYRETVRGELGPFEAVVIKQD
jgi:glycosidase